METTPILGLGARCAWCRKPMEPIRRNGRRNEAPVTRYCTDAHYEAALALRREMARYMATKSRVGR